MGEPLLYNMVHPCSVNPCNTPFFGQLLAVNRDWVDLGLRRASGRRAGHQHDHVRHRHQHRQKVHSEAASHRGHIKDNDSPKRLI